MAGCGTRQAEAKHHGDLATKVPGSPQPAPGEAGTSPSGAKAGSVGGDVKAGVTWHAVERSRRFQRRAIRIPEAVDTSNVNATYTDGVLTVTIPKVVTPSTRTMVVIS